MEKNQIERELIRLNLDIEEAEEALQIVIDEIKDLKLKRTEMEHELLKTEYDEEINRIKINQ